MFDLIMLLVTKMANGGKELTDKQQSLSNAIQLIHIGNLVHQKGVFDLSKVPNFGNNLPEDHDLILGNKIALLAGDFLLANAQIKVTQMRYEKSRLTKNSYRTLKYYFVETTRCLASSQRQCAISLIRFLLANMMQMIISCHSNRASSRGQQN